MKKGVKIKLGEIIAILRQVEVMISQGKTVPMACKDYFPHYHIKFSAIKKLLNCYILSCQVNPK